ncbi:MAG: Ni/Fe-hydrogenase, b-type cytochrome subunit [Zoogloeaceae bacterium]|nr:Ni/Fe-hydrogenase, b-type cytochrome subunit [Zoogloeaceae bacterium]
MKSNSPKLPLKEALRSKKMLSAHAEREAQDTGYKTYSVYVYEAPVRAWHWINALAIFILMATGYLIGKPLPTMDGEAYNQFTMGYLRFTHFAAAYVFTIGVFVRIYWAFVGNSYARQIFVIPIFEKEWWHELWYTIRWYLFLEPQGAKKYIGHNPVAQVMMFFFFVILSIGMLLTGWALYSEPEGAGSVSSLLFGWVLTLLGGSADVHAWHRLGMWLMLCFALAHIYAAVREDILSKQALVSTMISGWRMFKS